MHEKNHEHAHHHGAESGPAVSEMEKLRKMTEHWISHNEEHARSYRQWADRAREAGQEQPGRILDEIAAGTLEQNKRLEQVLVLLNPSREG